MNAVASMKPLWANRALVRGMAGPILIMMVMAMMVLPLPPLVLDLLFTFNIALAIMVLLVSLYSLKPLDFASFPTVLLMSTLMRLSLNVASTRIVLLEGHTGPDAAGKVIEAFGHFLVGGNYTVGIVVFVILTIINFVVITKGAGRIAEVSARFTLDAMPGKQMAIDADLNAGLIGEDEARKRRAQISQEANFFGSMDGASKFVRGDAVAGVIIMGINIVGGLVVGVFQHDLDLAEAARNYTLLTIGDGLVAQIPALIISTAAGMVVSRVLTDEDLGQQVVSQLFSRPQVLGLAGGILGIMGLVPGMPHFAFLLLALILGGAAWAIHHAPAADEQPKPGPVAGAVTPVSLEASWDDVQPVDVLGLEVGYRLIQMVDKANGGELLKRIMGIRKKFAQEIGFLPAAVHIRDNLELKPNAYRITLKGVEIGTGEAQPTMFLAINPGRVLGTLPGIPTHDPAFGLPAVWVDAAMREQAQSLGYTVADASTVVATHLNHLVQTHAAELLGRGEVQQLLDHLAKTSPKLVEDVVPKLLPVSTVQKVLHNLLEEAVHIRDMRTIVETLADHAAQTQNATALTSAVRIALGRSITQTLFPSVQEMSVMSLNPALERLLMQAMSADADGGVGVEPGLANTLMRDTAAAAERQEQMGLPPVMLVPAQMRAQLSRFLRRTVPQLKVLTHAEIPDTRKIRVAMSIGGEA